jgi:hypothetical protein
MWEKAWNLIRDNPARVLGLGAGLLGGAWLGYESGGGGWASALLAGGLGLAAAAGGFWLGGEADRVIHNDAPPPGPPGPGEKAIRFSVPQSVIDHIPDVFGQTGPTTTMEKLEADTAVRLAKGLEAEIVGTPVGENRFRIRSIGAGVLLTPTTVEPVEIALTPDGQPDFTHPDTIIGIDKMVYDVGAKKRLVDPKNFAQVLATDRNGLIVGKDILRQLVEKHGLEGLEKVLRHKADMLCKCYPQINRAEMDTAVTDLIGMYRDPAIGTSPKGGYEFSVPASVIKLDHCRIKCRVSDGMFSTREVEYSVFDYLWSGLNYNAAESIADGLRARAGNAPQRTPKEGPDVPALSTGLKLADLVPRMPAFLIGPGSNAAPDTQPQLPPKGPGGKCIKSATP